MLKHGKKFHKVIFKKYSDRRCSNGFFWYCWHYNFNCNNMYVNDIYG